MKLLYIGEYIPGCTSRFRAEQLCALLQPEYYMAVDTHEPVSQTSRLFRSLGWRFKKGPLIRNVNQYICQQLADAKTFDLVWVDKADFLTSETTGFLRRLTSKLVHYTPDNIFYTNRSSHFEASAKFYDYCITTKSFETEAYQKSGVKNVLFCTQGFNPEVHHPYNEADEKKGVLFAGLYEPYRGSVISALLNANIPVKLAGKGWKPFLLKYKSSPWLEFKGEQVMGNDYGRLISSAQIGLGLLSKHFPELHTTRTFEIPACNTLLATEKNSETASLFNEDEACFFETETDLVSSVSNLLNDPNLINARSEKAYHKIISGGFDNASILRNLLVQIRLL